MTDWAPNRTLPCVQPRKAGAHNRLLFTFETLYTVDAAPTSVTDLALGNKAVLQTVVEHNLCFISGNARGTGRNFTPSTLSHYTTVFGGLEDRHPTAASYGACSHLDRRRVTK